jgi:hypothetical protein
MFSLNDRVFLAVLHQPVQITARFENSSEVSIYYALHAGGARCSKKKKKTLSERTVRSAAHIEEKINKKSKML